MAKTIYGLTAKYYNYINRVFGTVCEYYNYELVSPATKEITKEIEAIKEKYRFPLIDAEKNIKSNLEAVQEFNNLLTNYSTFDEHMITDAICLLIHIVEEQNFQYQKANYYIEYLFYGIWGGSEERFNLWKAKIIVNAEKRRDEYYHLLDEEDEVKKLVEGGDAILLQKVGYSIPKKDGKIIFYFLNDHHNMTCSSDF